MYSGSYNGWRHTSLAEITPANVAQLNMRWVKQFDINDPNIEATPLVIDGTIFTVMDPGHVFALDAKTGATIWEYRRPIPSGLPIEFRSEPRTRGARRYALFRQSGRLFGRHQRERRKGHLANIGRKPLRRLFDYRGPTCRQSFASWSGSREASSEFAGFSLPMTYRPANSSGNLIRSRVLAKSDTKRGRTTHGDRVAVERGSPGAMIHRPICSTGASAIQVRAFQGTCALAITCSPTA